MRMKISHLSHLIFDNWDYLSCPSHLVQQTGLHTTTRQPHTSLSRAALLLARIKHLKIEFIALIICNSKVLLLPFIVVLISNVSIVLYPLRTILCFTNFSLILSSAYNALLNRIQTAPVVYVPSLGHPHRGKEPLLSFKSTDRARNGALFIVELALHV